MGLVEDLNEIKAIKDEIKQSITNKGIDTNNKNFSEYPGLIDSISNKITLPENLNISCKDYVDNKGLFYKGRNSESYDLLIPYIREIKNGETFIQNWTSITNEQIQKMKHLILTGDNSRFFLNQGTRRSFTYPNFDTSKNSHFTNFFFGNTVTFNDVVDVSGCSSFGLQYMFNNCNIINNTSKKIPISDSLGDAGNMAYMFVNSNLEEFSGVDCSNLHGMQSTFLNCTKLKKFESNIKQGYFLNAFQNCPNLTSIKFTNDCLNIVSSSSPLDISTTGITTEELLTQFIEDLPNNTDYNSANGTSIKGYINVNETQFNLLGSLLSSSSLIFKAIMKGYTFSKVS